MLKKSSKYISTGLLILILLILFIPSWRIQFQGWFQGIFMGDLVLVENSAKPLPREVANWEMQSIAGDRMNFSTFYDKPIVLSFWATWCPPCRAELKTLNRLKAELGNDIHFVSCTIETIETIKESNLHNDYSFLYSTPRFPIFFEMEAYPTLCIINNQHQLIFSHEGAATLDTEKNILFLRGLVENR